MKKLFLSALVIVLFLASCVALADKPPKELYQHVTTTSQLVYQGECKVETLKISQRPCLIFQNPATDRVWVVLFDQDNLGKPQVTHVIMVDEVGKEVIAWCRSNVCV